jgi:hypothetical protein
MNLSRVYFNTPASFLSGITGRKREKDFTEHKNGCLLACCAV